jgi:hypothetical protein
MLEIYQENIRDLLIQPNSFVNSELKVKESPKRGIYVEGLTEVFIVNEMEMLQLLSIGNQNRHVASTKMNSQSSRSHSIFILEMI